MTIISLLIIILLTLSNNSVVYSQENFSWVMFLPAITNQCRPDNLLFCNNQSICESREGYWYDDSCHSEPEPTCSATRLDLCATEPTCMLAGGYWYLEACNDTPDQWVCSMHHLDLCFNAEECSSIGGYWYELGCNEQQSPNYIKTEKLAGEWYIKMLPAGESSFTQTYTLDINTIYENHYGSGKFTVEGVDQDGNNTEGSYVPNNNYTMFVTKTAYDVQYEFDFISASNISGCYYKVDKLDGTKGPCVSMRGSKL